MGKIRHRQAINGEVIRRKYKSRLRDACCGCGVTHDRYVFHVNKDEFDEEVFRNNWVTEEARLNLPLEELINTRNELTRTIRQRKHS